MTVASFLHSLKFKHRCETATQTFYDRKVTQLSGDSLSRGCDVTITSGSRWKSLRVLLQCTVQGCQIGRLAAKFHKFGLISSWLAVRILGWAFGFFWPFFEGRLAEIFFCWPFLKICLYFKL